MSLLTFSRRAPKGVPVLVGALAALSALSGCTPATDYRYTGLVPAARALAWDGRTSPDGSLRIDGTMSSTSVHRNLDPQAHDTALHVPNTTFEGSAHLAATPEVELGARYAYAAYDWSEASAQGTMPLPSKPSVWGVGPEIRATIPLDRRKQWAIGLAGNLMRYETPYAEWQLLKSGTCNPNADVKCAFDPFAFSRAGAYYTLNAERSESHVTMNIAVYPSLALGRDGDYGHLFGGFAVHSTFKNDGFTDTQSSGSTIQDAGLIYIAGIGYGVAFDPMHVAAMLTLPLTTSSSSINYGPSGFVTVGVDLSLWESKAEKRKHRELEERRHIDEQRMEDERRRALPQAPTPPASPPPHEGERSF
jgi:hypothetical protein